MRQGDRRLLFSPETFSKGLSGLDACRVALTETWRIYAIEATGLAGFLFVVGVVDSVLFASDSPVEPLIDSDVVKRVLVGLAAGLYLIALVYSPFGTASGAHINPSVTLGFLRLGKISGLDSAFYICAQFIGAVLGVALFAALMATWASESCVRLCERGPQSVAITNRDLPVGTPNQGRSRVLSGRGPRPMLRREIGRLETRSAACRDASQLGNQVRNSLLFV